MKRKATTSYGNAQLRTDTLTIRFPLIEEPLADTA